MPGITALDHFNEDVILFTGNTREEVKIGIQTRIRWGAFLFIGLMLEEAEEAEGKVNDYRKSDDRYDVPAQGVENTKTRPEDRFRKV